MYSALIFHHFLHSCFPNFQINYFMFYRAQSILSIFLYKVFEAENGTCLKKITIQKFYFDLT